MLRLMAAFLSFSAAMILCVAVLWSMNPSADYVRVNSFVWNPEENTVALDRVIRGDHILDIAWVVEVFDVDQNLICEEQGRSPFQAQPQHQVFPIAESLKPCLQTPGMHVTTLALTVYWGGIIPLRPYYYIERQLI